MTLRRLQLALIAVAVAAAVVMAGLLSTEARIACLAVIAVGAGATAQERLRPGGGWWWILAVGLLLSLAGFALAELSEPAETEAGIAAIAGAALTIAAAAVGFPLADA